MTLLLLTSATTTTATTTTRFPMEGITTFTLVLIAALAVLVVIGLIVGARLKRRRVEGQAEFERDEEAQLERQRSGEVERPASTVPPVNEPPEAAPATAPLPPPLDNSLAPGGAMPEQSAFSTPSPQPQAPAISPPPTAAAPSGGELTQLKGLGPKVAAALAAAGVTSLGQLAALSAGEAEALDAQLGTFRGRMARDRWIEQARLLSSGDRAAYEREFGKLG